MASGRRTTEGAAWDQFNFQSRDRDLPRMNYGKSSPALVNPQMSRLRSFEYDENMQQFLSDTEEKGDDVLRTNYFSNCLRLDDTSDLVQPTSHQWVEENYFSKDRRLKQNRKPRADGSVRENKEHYDNYYASDNNYGGNPNPNQYAMNVVSPGNQSSSEQRYSPSRQTPELQSDLHLLNFGSELFGEERNADTPLAQDYRIKKSPFSGFRNNVDSHLPPRNFTPEFCSRATNTELHMLNDDFSSTTNNSESCSSWVFYSSGKIGGGAVPKKKKSKNRNRDNPVAPFPFPASPDATTQFDVGTEVQGQNATGRRSEVEVAGSLHGIVPVLISLKQLSTDKKRQIANSCWMAICGSSPNIGQSWSQDVVGQADVSGSGCPVHLSLTSQCLQLKMSSGPGGSRETVLATHQLRRLGLFHGYPNQSNTLVYAGHSDMGGRTAVVITLCNYEHYTCVMEHLKNNTGAARLKKM